MRQLDCHDNRQGVATRLTLHPGPGYGLPGPGIVTPNFHL